MEYPLALNHSDDIGGVPVDIDAEDAHHRGTRFALVQRVWIIVKRCLLMGQINYLCHGCGVVPGNYLGPS